MKYILYIVAFLFTFNAFGQQKVWVFFNEKKISKSDWNHPEKYLSEKSLERRAKQNIELNKSDFPVNDEFLKKLRNRGFEIKRKSKWLNAASVVVYNESDIIELKSFPFVRDIEKVHSLKLSYDPNTDFSFSKTTNPFVYGNSFFQIDQLKGTDLHDKGFMGQGMLIAVIDGGFVGAESYQIFDSLWANNQILSTYNFVDDDTNVFQVGSHGTSVLSVMGGYLDGSLVGTAPKADYVLLRSEDQSQEVKSEEDNWIAAAEYADSVGADIINSSVGYYNFDNGMGDYTYADFDGRTTVVSQGAIFAHRKGIVVCNSMGNEGVSPWKYMLSPADVDSILSVGGVNSNGNYAGFASVGPTADGRLKPNVSALAVGVYVINSNNAVTPGNGTSFSSPLIAGLTACLWQASPNKTYMEIIEIIEMSSHMYFNPDTLVGHGIPNFETALALTSLNEDDIDLGLTIYPNPFQEYILINAPTSINLENIECVLFDSLGKECSGYKSINEGGSIYISGLNDFPNGIYFLKVITEKGSQTFKLVH